MTYSYLLRGFESPNANRVWAASITYIPMTRRFLLLCSHLSISLLLFSPYGVASRIVFSWRLSNTLDNMFCVDALEEDLSKYGCPDIFNMDQGSQFTSDTFTGTLHSHNVSISMDGKGC
ncbi:MAG: DDE-type integrase/transposase/recombinase [Deltaproteobacteria bacterium]|nr:DDE-type integrase/transposase/recombinase [Deltaproteobacteria bacterium]